MPYIIPDNQNFMKTVNIYTRNGYIDGLFFRNI